MRGIYYCCGLTDKGIRPHNEDAFLIHRLVLTEGVTESYLKPPFLIGVADGVSGEQSGELASANCLQMLRDVSFRSRTDMGDILLQIHRNLAQIGFRDEETVNMQTTLCAVGLDEREQLHSFNVGDSRLYSFRDGRMEQLSRDQSLVQLLYEQGTITAEERETHRQRHIIFPVLGNLMAEPEFDIRSYAEPLWPEEILLLCSDGLSDYVRCEEMAGILSLPEPLVRRVHLLAELALKKGSRDNITVLCLKKVQSDR